MHGEVGHQRRGLGVVGLGLAEQRRAEPRARELDHVEAGRCSGMPTTSSALRAARGSRHPERRRAVAGCRRSSARPRAAPVRWCASSGRSATRCARASSSRAASPRPPRAKPRRPAAGGHRSRACPGRRRSRCCAPSPAARRRRTPRRCRSAPRTWRAADSRPSSPSAESSRRSRACDRHRPRSPGGSSMRNAAFSGNGPSKTTRCTTFSSCSTVAGVRLAVRAAQRSLAPLPPAAIGALKVSAIGSTGMHCACLLARVQVSRARKAGRVRNASV